MARLQLALNVANLEEAVTFYTTLFRTGPAKRHPGYANFALDDPPLKLVLVEDPLAAGTINHLGVEVFSTDEVNAAAQYLADEGLAVDVESAATCCYAVQDKVWVSGPDGARWEVYTVRRDVDQSSLDGSSTCGASSGVARVDDPAVRESPECAVRASA